MKGTERLLLSLMCDSGIEIFVKLVNFFLLPLNIPFQDLKSMIQHSTQHDIKLKRILLLYEEAFIGMYSSFSDPSNCSNSISAPDGLSDECF
jgi:hypothetical protein